MGAYTRAFWFFVSSYGQDLKWDFLYVSLSASVANHAVKVEMFDAVLVDLVKRYQLIRRRIFRNTAISVTVGPMGTVDNKVPEICLDKSIVLCVCAGVMLFFILDLPTSLAFKMTMPKTLHSTY